MSEEAVGLKKEIKVQLVPFNKLFSGHNVVGKIYLKDAEVLESSRGSVGTVLYSRKASKMNEEKGGRKVMDGSAMRGAFWPEMEDHLCNWVFQRQQKGEIVSRESIRNYALQWAKKHPKVSQGFTASEGWCRKFLRRKTLVLRPGRKKRLGCSEGFERMAQEGEEEEVDVGQVEVKRKADSDPEEGRSRVTKRTIKKPKMDQFVTFSDCSDLEEEVGRDMTDFEFSDDDSSYRGENDDREDDESLDGQLARDSREADEVSWAKLRIPDEVAIQEVNPGLEVYMETADGKSIKTEPCEQNPFVESTSEFDVDSSNMEVVRYASDKRIQEENPLSDSQNEAAGGRRFMLDATGHLTLSLEKKKQQSPVWRHFKRHPTLPNIATCNHCSMSLKMCRGSTSTLARHVLRHLKQRKAIADGGSLASIATQHEVKRRRYSLEEKINMLKAVDKGMKKSEVAHKFGIRRSTLSSILSQRSDIVNATLHGLDRKRLKSIVNKDLDQAVYDWFSRLRSQWIPVSGQLLQERARMEALRLGMDNFVASNGWLHKFKKRWNVASLKIFGEEVAVGPDVVEGQEEELPSLIEDVSDMDLVIPSAEPDASPIQVSAVQSLRTSPLTTPTPPRKKTRDRGINVSLSIPPERPPVNVERFKVITDKVAQMLVKDYQSAGIVGNSGFRNLLAELEPNYKLPSASHFAHHIIPELHKKTFERKKKEKSAVVRNSKWCSLTVDQWTSGVGSSVYLAMTCHYMTEDFGVSRLFLANSRLPGKQSGQDMHRTIVNALEDWGFNISEIQLYVVTECARDLQAAASSSKSPWTVLQCFAHCLHLVIRGAMDSTPGYLELARKTRDISHRYSTVDSARKELRAILRKQGTKKTPQNDDSLFPPDWEGCEESSIQGHWVREYRMIERLVNLKEAIKTELSIKGAGAKLGVDVTEEEWELAEAVVDVLRPLVEALKDFCSLTYPPLSMTIPIIYGMEHMLAKVLADASGTAPSPAPPLSPSPKRSRTPTPPPPVSPPATFARNLQKAVRSRFPSYKTNRTSLVAMVLDPRYKAVILSEQEVNLVTKMLVDEIVEASALPTTQPATDKPSVSKEGEGGESENKRASSKGSGGLSSLLWSAFEEVSREQPPGAGRKVALYQVKQYLDEPVLSRDCEPLPWWTENRDKYNLILPVARKYASIPATQVKGSMLMGESAEEDSNTRRLFLPESQVEHLVFLHENS